MYPEIDLLIEEDGQTKAVEIKSSQTFNPRLLAGLITWQKLSGFTPAQQYLVYAGQQQIALTQGQLLPWQRALATI